MGVKELGHVVLYVRDLQRSASFYRDVLGFPQVFGDSDAPFGVRRSPQDEPITSCC